MTYIILVAGKGTRLHPLTLHHPKSLYKLSENTTVLQRMVRSIRRNDHLAEIIVVVGFMHEQITDEIKNENVTIIHNPFFSITNSIASLWFARKYLERENVTIIDGDIVLDEGIMIDFVCKETRQPYVLVDSSCKDTGDYNVQIFNDKVCVMSKNLTSFYAEYACVTKLDAVSSRLLMLEIDSMVNNEMFDQYFENALVQMIFEKDFELFFRDIKDYKWTEVDSVDDLLKAREIERDSLGK
jgi:choline kinase